MNFPAHNLQPSKQPHIPKQNRHCREKYNPHPPPHPRSFRHPEHTIHRSPQADARIVKGIIHGVGEGGGVADFVADGQGDLSVKAHNQCAEMQVWDRWASEKVCGVG